MKKKTPTRSIRRKAKAMGSPETSKMIKPTMKNAKTAHHSIIIRVIPC
jgi:hypothetical protein